METESTPKIYRMKLCATNEVRAKSKFWYYTRKLKKVKKSNGNLLAINEDSMRYDHLRDVVAKRKPGWEYLQEALISIDPARARTDPVVVKNIPYYKAKKALETEVMKLDPPPRPQNWGELNLPLNSSAWSEEYLKDTKKLYEMTVLLNAQREMADKILDVQWETKWRQEKDVAGMDKAAHLGRIQYLVFLCVLRTMVGVFMRWVM